MVGGLPSGEQGEIARFNGRWRILCVRGSAIEDYGRDYASADATFEVLVEEYANR